VRSADLADYLVRRSVPFRQSHDLADLFSVNVAGHQQGAGHHQRGFGSLWNVTGGSSLGCMVPLVSQQMRTPRSARMREVARVWGIWGVGSPPK